MEPSGDATNAQFAEPSESAILRKYYADIDFFVSLEGILKMLSLIVCVVTSVVFLMPGGCADAPALLASGAAVALAGGALAALFAAGVLLRVPLYCPQGWFITDIVVSTVTGVLLLVMAALDLAACERRAPLHYARGPVGVACACTVTGGAAATYAAAMRRGDAARTPREPRRPTPTEQEV